MKPSNKCRMPHCRGKRFLDYLGTPLCEKHWDEHGDDFIDVRKMIGRKKK